MFLILLLKTGKTERERKRERYVDKEILDFSCFVAAIFFEEEYND